MREQPGSDRGWRARFGDGCFQMFFIWAIVVPVVVFIYAALGQHGWQDWAIAAGVVVVFVGFSWVWSRLWR
jgi:hypothetical protein